MNIDGDGQTQPFDIAVIGGGINGCAIARDAAGRGLSVLLLEQGDLASATSSASSKLIHGGIRYLEHYDLKLVRESLKERDVILNIAPHICRPMRFIFPHNPKMRPMWLIRLGLFLYDHLGGHEFRHSRRIPDFRDDPAGRLLKPEFTRAFEYADCWTDDSRLVILTARDAADRGARILARTRCTHAASTDGVWSLDAEEVSTGQKHSFMARQLVNATGPWASAFLSRTLEADFVNPVRASTRNVKGSHLIVRKWFDHDHAYVLQNPDERIVFVLPFEDDYVLIGTTDVDYEGDPGRVQMSNEERRYLLDCVNDYFNREIPESDIIGSVAGVRPLYKDGSSKPQETSRGSVLRYSTTRDGAGLLNVFGGKLTTHRKLAESALHEIERHTDRMPPPWTSGSPLPGGDFKPSQRSRLIAEYVPRFPFVPEDVLQRWFRSYGLEIEQILDGAGDDTALGHHFGAGLFEIEVRWMVDNEWARTSDDVLWRRSKLGLRADEIDLPALEEWLEKYATGHQDEQLATG
ncbi:MAG: glycerol-3-phosphate dehydrogenase [Halofilum sp. (in: g-proteobacteria)]|nr:glycerol-3-phosphate dehydrogenase [Halofilum sp. (in: g-proteobacteria)]